MGNRASDSLKDHLQCDSAPVRAGKLLRHLFAVLLGGQLGCVPLAGVNPQPVPGYCGRVKHNLGVAVAVLIAGFVLVGPHHRYLFVGNLNNLSLKVFGTKAGLEWAGETPEVLRFTPYGEPTRLLVRGGPANWDEARRGSRMPAGHPEGYVEGFANLYRDAAELVRARRAGRAPDPAALAATPDVVDGARGVAFVEAAVASSRNNGAWTSARLV